MKKYVLIIAVPLVILVAIFAAYKFFGQSSTPGYIFFITLDTTRADFIDYSVGKTNRLSPNIAKLAASGMVFDHAYSVIPITLPSHSTMFYSLPPHVLRVYNNGQPRKINYPSLSQLLKSKDYFTGAVVSLGVLKAEFGLSKGFDEYIENFRPNFWYKTAEEVTRDAQELVSEVTAKEKKAFFWIHYSDPHEPYYPPYFKGNFQVLLNGKEIFKSLSTEQPLVNLDVDIPAGESILQLKTEPPAILSKKRVKIGFYTYHNFSITSPQAPGDLEVVTPKWRVMRVRGKENVYAKEKESEIKLLNKAKKNIRVNIRFLYRMLERPASRVSLYRKEINYMDRHLGRFIDFLKEKGIYDQATFIMIGDHGEGLGEYNRHYGHIHYLNKVYTHVPLIIFGKGIEAKGRLMDTVSNLNIAPTILDIAGIEKPSFMQGDSLLSSLPKHKLLLETYAPEAYFDSFSIIDYPYQICFHPGRKEDKLEYYNLDEDNWGVFDLEEYMQDKKLKGDLFNTVLKVSRIITATKKNVTNKALTRRQKEILESLGYLTHGEQK